MALPARGPTPEEYGTPRIVDETLKQLDASTIEGGTWSASASTPERAQRLRGRWMARERGAYVICGGIHATLYPEESLGLGQAHGFVKGDGDVLWGKVLAQCAAGKPERGFEAGRIPAEQFQPARWELLSARDSMWASVQTVRGCPKHCSFCSVWRADGTGATTAGIGRRYRRDRGASPSRVPVHRICRRQLLSRGAERPPSGRASRLQELKALREEHFELMARMAKLPSDMVFFTQITTEAAEGSAFLDAMRNANIKGALVGIESVTPEGLKAVYRDFNASGAELIQRPGRSRWRRIPPGSGVFR